MVGVASEGFTLEAPCPLAGCASVIENARSSNPTENFNMFDASEFAAFEGDETLYNKIRWRAAKFHAPTFAIISTGGMRGIVLSPRDTAHLEQSEKKIDLAETSHLRRAIPQHVSASLGIHARSPC